MSEDLPPDEKFNRLVSAVSEQLGIQKFQQAIEDQQKTLDRFLHELGNTNAIVKQIVDVINGNVERPQTTTSGTATEQPQQYAQVTQPSGVPLEMKMQAISQIKEAIAPLVDLYKAYKGMNQPQQSSFFDDEWIKGQIMDMVKENISLGQDITQSVRRSLTSKKARDSIYKALESPGVE